MNSSIYMLIPFDSPKVGTTLKEWNGGPVGEVLSVVVARGQ